MIIEEINLLRELGVDGFSLFAFWPVAEEEGYLETLRREVFPTPTAIPATDGENTRGEE